MHRRLALVPLVPDVTTPSRQLLASPRFNKKD